LEGGRQARRRPSNFRALAVVDQGKGVKAVLVGAGEESGRGRGRRESEATMGTV